MLNTFTKSLNSINIKGHHPKDTIQIINIHKYASHGTF